jgi:hypothetical protein
MPGPNVQWSVGVAHGRQGPKKCAGRVQPMLVALVAFMTALAASRSGAFGVVGEVVGIVFLAAADLLLRHSLLAGRVFLRLGFVGMLILCRHSLAQRIHDASLRDRAEDGKVYPWRVGA